MTHLPRAAALSASLVIAAAALTACSTGATGSAGDSARDSATHSAAATGGTPAEEGAFPVSIEHTFGTTEITTEPTKVVTIGWADADFALDLGVAPIAAPEISWGGNAAKSTDWYDAELAKVGAEAPTRFSEADGVPFDEIAQQTPDLILAVTSGISKADYTKLSKIAPVVAYPGAPWGTSWQDSLSMIGDALGRPAAAAEIAEETQEEIDEGIEQNPAIQGKSAAWVWFTADDTSKIGLYTSNDVRPQMLREYGMVDAKIVNQLSDGTAFSAELSAEKAETLDADVIVFYAESAPKNLTKQPLLGRIPALQQGSYVSSADNQLALTMSLPTPLNIPLAVDEFLPQLNAAAQKAS